MKNIVKEGNVETLNKNILKAKYLKKLSYISIIIELISFSIMEILELIYSTNEIMQESIYFAIKVIKNNDNLDFDNFDFISFFILFDKNAKNKMFNCWVFNVIIFLIFQKLIFGPFQILIF